MFREDEKNLYNSRWVRNVRMSYFDFDPTAEVQGTAVEYVEVLGRQEMNREENERTDPDEGDMLSNPPRIIIQTVL